MEIQHEQGNITRWRGMIEFCTERNIDPITTFKIVLRRFQTSGGITPQGDGLMKGTRTQEEIKSILREFSLLD